jgi:hypothetical protein
MTAKHSGHIWIRLRAPSPSRGFRGSGSNTPDGALNLLVPIMDLMIRQAARLCVREVIIDALFNRGECSMDRYRWHTAEDRQGRRAYDLVRLPTRTGLRPNNST